MNMYRNFGLLLLTIATACSLEISYSRSASKVDWKTIVLENEDELMVPEDFELVPAQGIDTYVGSLESPDITINFDIGFFAGEYVSSSDKDVTCIESFYESFCYKEDFSNFLATFPEAGPANFTSTSTNTDLIVQILETYNSK